MGGGQTPKIGSLIPQVFFLHVDAGLSADGGAVRRSHEVGYRTVRGGAAHFDAERRTAMLDLAAHYEKSVMALAHQLDEAIGALAAAAGAIGHIHAQAHSGAQQVLELAIGTPSLSRGWAMRPARSSRLRPVSQGRRKSR